MRQLKGTSTTTVGTSLTTLTEFFPAGMGIWAGMEILNGSGAALTDLQVQFRFYESSGNYFAKFVKADFDAMIAGTVQPPPDFDFPANMVSAGFLASGKFWLRFSLSGVFSIRIQATVASGTTSVTLNYTGATEKV